MQYILVAALFVIGGVAGNLIAGWLQKDVLSDVFRLSRVIASIIIAVMATLLGMYLQEYSFAKSNDQAFEAPTSSNQEASIQGDLNNNTIVQSGGGDVNITVLSPPTASPIPNATDMPLLISGELIPAPGIEVWFSPNPVQGETAEYPQLPAFYPQVSTIEMQIESLQKSQAVRLPKLALLRLAKFAPPETSQVYVGSPMGGWGYYHHFSVELSPEFAGKVLEGTRLEHPDPTQGQIGDFFVIDPGEVELVSYKLDFRQPGVYVFEVGLEYVFQGQRHQLWVPESFTVQVPEIYYVWDWMTSEFTKYTFAEFTNR